MAAIINKSLALVAVTLCFLLALAAAQAKNNNNVTLVVQGQAKCKNNPSMVMSNTTLYLLFNGTRIPGTGTTTSTGKIVMTVKLTSPQHLELLMSNSSQKLVVAPPHACGAQRIPAGTVVGAPLRITPLQQQATSSVISSSQLRAAAYLEE